MVKPKRMLYQIKHGPYLHISLFSTDNFVKISIGRFCNHGISTLASLFVTDAYTTLYGALMPILCVQN